MRIYDMIENKLELAYDYTEEDLVKNIQKIESSLKGGNYGCCNNLAAFSKTHGIYG